MVGRIETGAGVGLFHYEFTTVLVTDQEQHWLTMRYPPAVPRRHGQVLGLNGKQRRTGAGVEAHKLSGEYSPSRHLYSQRTDLPSVIKHGEHGTVGDDQSLQVSGAAASPLDTHAHHGVLPGLDGRWQCGWWQIGVCHNFHRRLFWRRGWEWGGCQPRRIRVRGRGRGGPGAW